MMKASLRFKPSRSETKLGMLFAIAAMLVPGLFAQSSQSAPRNLSRGLRELVAQHQAAIAEGHSGVNLRAPEGTIRGQHDRTATGVFRVRSDRQNRVLVNVHLDGSMAMKDVKASLESMGASVVASNTSYRRGVLSAYVPLGSVTSAARGHGVSSMALAHSPKAQVGLTTSQGAALLRGDIVNAHGTLGSGVTVGLLSDSFNTGQLFGVADTAAVDVQNGDLPAISIIPGGEGLKFLIELDPTTFGPQTDEGRGMAQIVHDVAPGAALCFATAFVSDVDFANNIVNLRADPGCAADVIADDVEYFNEPYFSDGIIAQAVDTATGLGAAYFSSAGNQAQSGYSSNLRFIDDAQARALTDQTVDLSQIPAGIDTSGGFHNFDPGSGVSVSQPLFLGPGPIFSVQWDDPFDQQPSGISTDLAILFFDANGDLISEFTADDDNFSTNEPIELFQLCTASKPNDPDHSCDANVGVVQMVIARKDAGTHLAKRVKYIEFQGVLTDLSGLITPQTPIIFGHTAAKGANSVAAVEYNVDPAFFTVPNYRYLYEGFSSPGPVTIAFDSNGNRLGVAETRQKPDIASPDGGNTSFFPEPELFGPGQDYEALFGIPDGFPNFFGTSAAAPHAAAVAALMIEKAGGPGSLSPQKIAKALKASAPRRDVDLFFSQAVSAKGGATVLITASGQQLGSSGRSKNFFTVNFNSTNPNDTLDSITIDLTATGLVFDVKEFPITLGGTTGPSISSSLAHQGSPTATINFKGFTSGNSLSFGVDRDFTDVNGKVIEAGGSSADEVAGATVVSTVADHVAKTKAKILFSVFNNALGTGYRIYDGMGLIDAVQAVKLVP